MPSPKIINLRPSSLTPYARNARKNEAAVGAVMASIQEFGFRNPILWWSNPEGEREIVAGHTRWTAATQLQLATVPTMDVSDLPPEKIKALRLVDNKTSELAEWDETLLSEEMAILQGMGMDFSTFGWEQEELAALQAAQEADAGGETGDPSPEPATPATRVRTEAEETRISIGEFTFFITVPDYRAWADEVRKANGHEKTRVILDLATRLGMLEQFKATDSGKAALQAAQKPEVVNRTLSPRKRSEITSSPTPNARVRTRAR